MSVMDLDHTHDAMRKSWVRSANDAGTDFPIQNLPFGVFRRAGTDEAFRGGVAIGDQVLDLGALEVLGDSAREAVRACAGGTLNDFFAMGPSVWRALRHTIFALLEDEKERTKVAPCLVAQVDCELGVPARIGDYTDFYTSYFHAHNIGQLLGLSGDAVPDNFHWIPLGYHGRASSIGVSGRGVRRPRGHSRAPGATAPAFGPCAKLDYEVELGFYVGVGNALGEPLPLDGAEAHLFGASLLNDWSARDIQAWEMAPLGPFLAKNFATTISPWIVTMDALAPFRVPFVRPGVFPGPSPHLVSDANRARGGIDVRVEMWLETEERRSAGMGAVRLSSTSFRHQHWTVGQMLAHHTSGGCNLRPGDLVGSGTISGPTAEEAGALMELSRGGARPVRLEGPSGAAEERSFLCDGDAVLLRGFCTKPGFARIGFGECRGVVLPAPA